MCYRTQDRSRSSVIVAAGLHHHATFSPVVVACAYPKKRSFDYQHKYCSHWRRPTESHRAPSSRHSALFPTRNHTCWDLNERRWMRITRTQSFRLIYSAWEWCFNLRFDTRMRSPQSKVLEIAGGGTCTKFITGRPKRSGLG